MHETQNIFFCFFLQGNYAQRRLLFSSALVTKKSTRWLEQECHSLYQRLHRLLEKLCYVAKKKLMGMIIDLCTVSGSQLSDRSLLQPGPTGQVWSSQLSSIFWTFFLRTAAFRCFKNSGKFIKLCSFVFKEVIRMAYSCTTP